MGVKNTTDDDQSSGENSDVSEGQVVAHGSREAITLDEETRREAGLEHGEKTVSKVDGKGRIIVQSFYEALEF